MVSALPRGEYVHDAALEYLGTALAERGQHARALRLLRGRENLPQRDAKRRICLIEAEAGNTDGVVQAARELESDFDRQRALADASVALARHGSIGKALQIVRAINYRLDYFAAQHFGAMAIGKHGLRSADALQFPADGDSTDDPRPRCASRSSRSRSAGEAKDGSLCLPPGVPPLDSSPLTPCGSPKT